MTMKIGVVGLGLMGLSIAKNLAKAGFSVTAYDTRPGIAAGIDALTQVADVAEVGRSSDIVFLSLPGPVEVTDVCTGEGGLAGTMREGGTVFDLSTNSVATVKSLRVELAKKGIRFLDAPVSGGPWGAADGTLAIWVGGDKEAYEQGRPALDAIGKRITHMGDIGTGTVTKLVHNTAANIRTAMLGEVLALGVKGGIEPTALFSAIRDGSHGRQRTFDSLGGKILDGSFDDPAFKLRHARKDMAVAIELGGELGVPMDLTAATMIKLEEAMERGWGDRDSNSHVKIQQEKAGIEVPPVEKSVLAAIVARD